MAPASILLGAQGRVPGLPSWARTLIWSTSHAPTSSRILLPDGSVFALRESPEAYTWELLYARVLGARIHVFMHAPRPIYDKRKCMIMHSSIWMKWMIYIGHNIN